MLLTKLNLALVLIVLAGATARAQGPAGKGAEEAQQEAQRMRAQKLKMGLGADLADMPADRLRALLDGIKLDDRMGLLVRALVETARIEADARWREFLEGRGTLSACLGASERLFQAELDLSNRREDRMAALQAYWQRSTDVETINQGRFDTQRVTVQDLAQARYYRLHAEILLERAKTGRPIEAARPPGDL